MYKSCKFVMGSNWISCYVSVSESLDPDYVLDSKIKKDFEDSTSWLFNKCSEMKYLGFDINFEYSCDLSKFNLSGLFSENEVENAKK